MSVIGFFRFAHFQCKTRALRSPAATRLFVNGRYEPRGCLAFFFLEILIVSMTSTVRPFPRQINGDNAQAVAMPSDVLVAAYHTAHEFPGGVPEVARRMNMSANTLQNKLNLNNTTHRLTLEEAVLMQDVTGDYRILHAMAGRLDHTCTSQQVAHDDCPTLTKVAELAKEFGDVLGAVNQSITGGDVKLNDMRNVEREAGELMAALHGLLANLRGHLPGHQQARS